MNKNITAMIFTFNEERRLPYVYENLKDFCEIIVFDGGSSDGTEQFCRDNKIRFILRPKSKHTQENRQTDGMWPGILKYAYSQCKSQYVIHVFCAHFFPKNLLEEFSKVANENRIKAVFHDVIIYRYGSLVHKAIIKRVSSGCVFYNKSIITFDDSKIHDELAIKFNEENMIRLKGKDNLSLHLFQDESYFSFTNKTTKYAEMEAKQKFLNGEKVGFLDIVFKPLSHLLYRYIRLGSFRYGARGLIYSLINYQYDLSVYIMLWEINNNLDLKGATIANERLRSDLIEGNKRSS